MSFPLALRPLLLALLASASGFAPPAQADPKVASPYPRFMPGYRFVGSLAEAIDAARGKHKIVVYTEYSVTLRNNLTWLMQQRAIFADEVTRSTLREVPIFATTADSGSVKSLRLPRMGLSVLSPDGKKVHAKIDLRQTDASKVPATLHELITGKPPAKLGTALSAKEELTNFRKQHGRILNALDQGDAELAETICRAEEKRLPSGFGPRLLRETIRAKRLATTYYKELPADRPHLDLVCIVPDRATFLATIAQWGKGPIFPILYLDAHYLPLFLAAFAPKKVVFVKRRGSKAALTDQAVFATWAKAFDGAAARDEKEAMGLWKQHEAQAPGVVFTHRDSEMLEAGVALAAGRRQMLALMAPIADPTKRVTFDAIAKIRSQVHGLFERNFLRAERLYDDIDFVTLATEQPFRYQDRLAADKTTYATDDAIARDRFEMPSACVGRLLGNRTQSLYMAMCALFLSPRKPLLFSRYQNSGSWAAYGTTPAATLFTKLGLGVKHIEHPEATLAAWQTLFTEPVSPFDLVHVNSSGGSRNWSTSSGNGSYDDLPLTVPAIVSYVHSNSLGNGYDSDTVGGRWLHNGAYTFYGSTSEPYLDAFVNIYAVLRRATREGWPLGMAHRLLPMQLRWRPWKLMFFGDPLIRVGGKAPERGAPIPVDGEVPVTSAASRNPFGLRGLDARIFKLASLIAQRSPKQVDRGLDTLLRTALRDKKITAAQRTAIADLVAYAALGTGDRDTLLERLSKMEKSAIESTRLRYVAHTFIKSRLFSLRSDPRAKGAGTETARLARAHASLTFSKVMFQRIGGLYQPLLKSLPDGRQQRKAIEADLRKRRKDRPALSAFLKAL